MYDKIINFFENFDIKKDWLFIVFLIVWGDYENIIMGSLKRLEKQLDLLLEYMRITVVTNLQN